MSSKDNIKSAKFNKITKDKIKEWKKEKLLKKMKKLQEEEKKKVAENEKKKKQQDNSSTISIAVPGSILDNAQSHELRTYLAGQVARAACMFHVDEIIIFDDIGEKIDDKKSKIEEEDGIMFAKRCCVQFARILLYLECPQYLRKHLFPKHNDLKFVGLLNPLDAPHHLRETDEFSFREGIVTNKLTKGGPGSYVNIGLRKDAKVDKVLQPNLRVTIKLLPKKEGSGKIYGEVVTPTTPRAETGVYWGYTVRLAKNLSQVFSQAPFPNGYDLTIGTSDKGSSVDEIENLKYNHALIVFGGLAGLEAVLENDEVLETNDPRDLFDYYLNTLPNQGSRTIRTEEAIIVSLATLRTKLDAKIKPKSLNTI